MLIETVLSMLTVVCHAKKMRHRLAEYFQVHAGLLAAAFNLIAATTTRTGLRIAAEIDTNAYPKGIQVTVKELEKIHIERADFHGEWNYTIRPST